MEKNVRLLGIRKDIPELLNISDVFVLPSLWEGLPNALLEAMIAGIPVVATDIGPNLEVIEDKRTGLLVPSGNSQALADAIIEIINNSVKAAALSQAAYQDVKKRFNLERMVKEHEEFYQKILTC